MSFRYRMLFVMTAAQLCASVTQHGFGALAPFVIDRFALTKAQFGACFTAMLLGSAISGAMSGLAVDRLGERRVSSACGSAVFAVLCACALAPSFPAFVGAMFVLGIVCAPLAPAGGRMILGWFKGDRGFAMGIRQTGIPAGAALGGLVLPFVAFHYDYRAALLVGGLFALIGTGGLPLFYREPEHVLPPVRGISAYFSGVREVFADGRTIPLVLTCIVLTSAMQLSGGFITLSAVTLGKTSLAVAAFVFATAQVGAVIGRLVWGWTSDVPCSGDRTLPLAFICAIGTLGGLGFALTSPSNLPLLFASSFVMGFTGSGWPGLFSTALAEIGGSRFAGSAMGLAQTANFGVAALTPIAFGAVGDRLGLQMSWVALAAALAAATIPALLAHRAFVKMRVAAS